MTVPKLNQERLRQIKFPLAPLSSQVAIVSEIKAEQDLVTSNRDLIAHFEKKIEAAINRVWGEDNATSASADATDESKPCQAAE